MRIVCYGDSNTFGYDPRSFFGGRYSAEDRWTDLTAAKTGHEVLNFGQNGREIPRRDREVANAAELIAAQNADLLIIMLGSNDLLMDADAQTAAQRMEHFIGALPLRCRDILLIAPPPMQYGEWAAEERILQGSRRLSAEYRRISERLGVRFADAGEWGIELQYDGVHFSEKGNHVFAEKLSSLIIL